MKRNLLKSLLALALVLVCGNVWGEGNYVKVTSTSALTDGQYLIVYETGGVALNGSLATIDVAENTVGVSPANGEIAYSADIANAAFTFKASDGSLLGKNGKYIGHSGSSNTLNSNTTAYEHTFTFDDEGNVAIKAKDNYYLRYNDASNQKRFRYYKSGQQAIQLYKYTEGTTPSKTLTSIAISGDATKKVYFEGEAFSTDGLTVTGTYHDKSEETITNGIEWTVTPSTLTAGVTSVTVTAKVNNIESEAFEVTGLSVTKEPENFTWNLSEDKTATANEKEMSWESEVAFMAVAKYNAQTATNNYYPGKGNTSTRFYTNSKLTITPADGYKIISLVFEATSENYAKAFSNSTWDNASATVSGNTTVNITPTDGSSACTAVISGTCGFTSVTVYYETAAVKEVDKIVATGMKTSFFVGDSFEFGGTVTATFVDGSNADVTGKAEFSGYDMNTPGQQTVTVTYNKETTTYSITIKGNVYASLEELIADGAPTETKREVTVTLTDVKIESIFVTAQGYRNGIFVKSGDQEVEIYSKDVPEPWEKGGTVSGTLTCPWVLYKGSTWELTPEDWTDLEYTAPKYYEVTISSVGYATFSSNIKSADEAVIIPEGVKAYTATYANKVVTLNEIEGGIIPAFEGVVLEGEPGTYFFEKTMYMGAAVADNDLWATGKYELSYEEMIDEGAEVYIYTLNNGSKGVNFYRMNEESKLGANKAYLPIAKAEFADEESSVSMRFGGDATLIESIHIVESNTYFDLQGRKVENPTNGLYIINGQKVLVK